MAPTATLLCIAVWNGHKTCSSDCREPLIAYLRQICYLLSALLFFKLSYTGIKYIRLQSGNHAKGGMLCFTSHIILFVNILQYYFFILFFLWAFCDIHQINFGICISSVTDLTNRFYLWPFILESIFWLKSYNLLTLLYLMCLLDIQIYLYECLWNESYEKNEIY